MYLQRSIRTAFSLAVAMLTAVVGLSIGFGIGASPVSATEAGDEQVFVQLINQLRADNGLSPLTVDAELTASARSWTATMSSNDSLSHTPDMAAGISAPWTVLGENVGVHSIHDLQQLFQAFVDSPTHYKNLTDPRFQYVGVGVVHAPNGKIWTTHRFMAANQPAAAPTTVPPTTTPPTTAPPVTAPPTTAPPATTPPATSAPTTAGAPATVPSTTKPTAPTPQSPPTSNVSPSGTSQGGTSQGGASPSSTLPANELPSDGELASDDEESSRKDMAELVQPDAETIETVLLDLMLAGV